MPIDRRVLFAWSTSFAVGACASSQRASPGHAAPAASSIVASAASPLPPKVAGAAPSEPLGRCDDWAFGPCAEGAQLHDVCRSHGVAFGPAKLPAYLACLETTLPASVVQGSGSCGEAARRCGKATAACDVLSRKAAACRKSVTAQCLESTQTCWKLCLEKGPKPQHACAKKCGEYDTASEGCVESESKAQCPSQSEDVKRCNIDAQETCKAAVGCQKSFSGVCHEALEAVEACSAKGKAP